MPGSDVETIGTSTTTPIVGQRTRDGDAASIGDAKKQEYRMKVDELSGSIEADTIAGSRTFQELSLYEKKSVLINRELE